jgi:sulfofructose kinase
VEKNIDILGLGCAAVDELLYVDAFPAADAKVQVRRRERHCGGLTATALVASARLGCKCAYASSLGDDDHSRFVLERLKEEGIDTRCVRRLPEARPVRSTIIVDQSQQTRAILFDLDGVYGADPSWPDESVILASRALIVDHVGVAGMVRAAKIARDAGIPVVADLESDDDPALPQLLELADHLILSHNFAQRVTGKQDAAVAVKSLWTSGRRAAVVTCGRDGCWYVSDQDPGIPHRLPALRVEAVDTTGCGDVFHGAYAAGLVHGRDVPSALRFATVAAGLKATRPGGQDGIPNRSTVEDYLATVAFTE